MSSNNTQSTTSSSTVRKCGLCREPGHNRRTCTGVSVDVTPLVHAHPHDDLYLLVVKDEIELTFDLIAPPVAPLETRTYTVGCLITSPYGVVTEATPTEFADNMLHIHDMWSDSSDVVLGMRKTYRVPEVSNPTTGTVSAYTSETCGVCKRVYSGADIVVHHHTHTQVERTNSQCEMIITKKDMNSYVAHCATSMQPTYQSEAEGLTDTGELTDAHVRERGMFLTCETIVHPVGKCKCMSSEVEENPFVRICNIEGGKSYTCTHGTTWEEVWRTSYTHVRWDHLRDSHLQERTYSDNIGHFGSNPIYAYLASQSETRKRRCADLAQWIQSSSLKGVLALRKSDALKVRRNTTVAAAVGFDATPEGKWDGVSGSDICGLVRHTPTTVAYMYTQIPLLPVKVSVDATCTRIADWSGIYLTKDQFEYLNLLMTKRVNGKDILTPAPKSAHVAVTPTVRHTVPQERTPGDILLRSRLMAYTLRLDSTKWDSADHNPHGSTGVPVYVSDADVALLHTLGYRQKATSADIPF